MIKIGNKIKYISKIKQQKEIKKYTRKSRESYAKTISVYTSNQERQHKALVYFSLGLYICRKTLHSHTTKIIKGRR